MGLQHRADVVPGLPRGVDVEPGRGARPPTGTGTTTRRWGRAPARRPASSTEPPVPACAVGQAGSRNQNVYTARISEGLFVTSPQNAKPLGSAVLRNFVVSAFNATSAGAHVHLRAASPLPTASTPPSAATAPPGRARSPSPSRPTRRRPDRLHAPRRRHEPRHARRERERECAPGHRSPGSVILNPPGLTFDLTSPTGPPPPSRAGEVLTVSIGAAHLSNANLSNAQPLERPPVEREPVERQPLQREPLERQPLQHHDRRGPPVEREPVERQSLERQPLQREPLQREPVERQPLQREPVERLR